MAAERTVRQLRVRAPDEALARRARLLLEDALRTASLPGEGGAVVLVRSLRLPPFRGAATPQSLALAIEARCRALPVLPVTSSTTEADIATAIAVRFRDPLHARLELGARVLRGAAPHAWCWPLAVPGFHSGLAAGEALRAVAISLCDLPEAEVALPLWLDEMVSRGGVPRLFPALAERDAERMMAALPTVARTFAERSAPATKGSVDGPADASARAALVHDTGPRPDWDEAVRWARRYLRASDARRHLLEACAHRTCGSSTGRATAAAGDAVAAVTRTELGAGPGERPDIASAAPTPEVAEQRPHDAAASPTDGAADGVALVRGRAGHPLPIEAAAATAPRSIPDAPDARGGRRDEDRIDRPGSAPAGSLGGMRERGDACRMSATNSGASMVEPTTAAGLLFLLPVLEALGLPDWIDEDQAWAGASLPARILACALRRLGLPDADPAWLLAAFDPATRMPVPASGRWDMLVAAGARTAAGRTAGGCASAEPGTAGRAIEEVWLSACRRWLRTRARLGLADLVCRPGVLAVTATHADVWLPIEQTDLRIRRAGLDLDPGWVPWLGRVVHFHYGDAES